MYFFPKISIVTPSFNQGKFIEETILSVLGQNYPNLEYIIIDGGSTDETVDIIRKYEKHLTYWVSEQDKGQGHAINKGFAMATGEIFGWLNSDDLYMPGTLQFMVECIHSPSTIYFGNCIHFQEIQTGGIGSWGSDVINSSKKSSLENIDYIIQPSSFWTKSVWETVGNLKEDMHFGFDWEWFLRAKNKGIVLQGVSRGLSLYRIHENHKSGVGGIKRQHELLSIYQEYSKRYARLYELLLNEDFVETTLKYRFFKKFLNVLNKPSGKAYILKLISKAKYSEFTIKEINNCLAML